MISDNPCLLPLEFRRVLYMGLLIFVWAYGAFVVWHWDFRVIRPLMEGVKRWGWRWLFFG